MASANTSTASSAGANDDALNVQALDAVNRTLAGGSSGGGGSDDGGAPSFPAVKLASGQTVRTGTVATLLHNIRRYDALAGQLEAREDNGAPAKGSDGDNSKSNAADNKRNVDDNKSDADDSDKVKGMQDMMAIEHGMRLALPTLELIGMFGLFAPGEWIASATDSATGHVISPGKKRVGELALEVGYGS